MNKKGKLVAEVIIGVILAAIVGYFVGSLASDFTRLSDQAKDSFYNLVDAIEKVNAEDPPAAESVIYIQDENTYLYPVTDLSRNFHVKGKDLIGDDVDFTLSHTKECETQNCLCLCREYDDETDRTCQNLVCEPLPEVSFSPGTVQIIDRGTGDDKGPRRQRVRIIKCNASEHFCKQSKEGDISVIFDWVDNLGVYGQIK